jgi:hypothetical protein
MSSSEPLWKAMLEAYKRSSGTIVVLRDDVLPGPERCELAAMMRAVAAWIKRKELEEFGVLLRQSCMWLDWLRAEADRAEESNG